MMMILLTRRFVSVAATTSASRQTWASRACSAGTRTTALHATTRLARESTAACPWARTRRAARKAAAAGRPQARRAVFPGASRRTGRPRRRLPRHRPRPPQRVVAWTPRSARIVVFLARRTAKLEAAAGRPSTTTPTITPGASWHMARQRHRQRRSL
jgi:hypothetical protein